MTDINDAGPRLRAMNDALEIARLRLTEAERSAIRDAADRYATVTPESAATAATLRGLLSRTGDCPAADNAADRNNGTTGGLWGSRSQFANGERGQDCITR